MRRTPFHPLISPQLDTIPTHSFWKSKFLSGSVYQYFNVPEQVYRGLMAASSHGTYFGEYIRMSYQYKQVL